MASLEPLLKADTAESYIPITDNPFLPAPESPLSTFSIDVDTAAYSNIRRFINGGSLPPPDAVRIEEMINYFDYDYPAPADDKPFHASIEIASCPWNPDHRLARIGLKGRVMPADERPDSNLVFLIDVSGSMNQPNKLPLVKESLKLLVHQLDSRDRVAMAVYAGNAGLVLPSTPAADRQVILDAIDRLEAGGSTDGGSGIQLAYNVASEQFIAGGVNRVILATDGDFNVGVTDRGELTNLIEEKARSGAFLSVLGYGMDNLNDATLETLADKGNGNYAYIDTLNEARKVLVEQLAGTLVTIAKDVKIQVEFNPARVAAYRLIGYENRLLAAADFNDDTKDAGEIGAGHAVTALYEIVPVGVAVPQEPLDFRPPPEPLELGTIVDPFTGELIATGIVGPAYLPNEEIDPTNAEAQVSADAELPEAPVAADASGPAAPAVDDDAPEHRPAVDPLKYQTPANPLAAALDSAETLTLKLRYKDPDGHVSKLIEFGVIDEGRSDAEASHDFQFAAAVAGFGMILRHSPYSGHWTLDAVAETAAAAIGDDPYGYRAEFVELVNAARRLGATDAQHVGAN